MPTRVSPFTYTRDSLRGRTSEWRAGATALVDALDEQRDRSYSFADSLTHMQQTMEQQAKELEEEEKKFVEESAKERQQMAQRLISRALLRESIKTQPADTTRSKTENNKLQAELDQLSAGLLAAEKANAAAEERLKDAQASQAGPKDPVRNIKQITEQKKEVEALRQRWATEVSRKERLREKIGAMKATLGQPSGKRICGSCKKKHGKRK